MAEFTKTSDDSQETGKKPKFIPEKGTAWKKEVERLNGFQAGINVGSRMLVGAIGGLLAHSLGFKFILTPRLDALVTEAAGPKFVRHPEKNQKILRNPVAATLFEKLGKEDEDRIAA